MKHICPKCKSENVLVTLIDADEIKDCRDCGHSWPVFEAGYDIYVGNEPYYGAERSGDAYDKFKLAAAKNPTQTIRLIQKWSDGSGDVVMEQHPIDQPAGHA